METLSSVSYLIKAGLRKDQATTYATLLSRGRLTASRLASYVPYSRTMVYKILEELIEFELVLKNEKPGTTATFECTHPLKLREWIQKEKLVYEQKSRAIETALTDLISTYTAVFEKPGVRLLQGTSGLEELYEDILNEQKPLRLIRSPYDDRFPEIFDRVSKQIQAQVKLGITTRAITPFDDETWEELQEVDPKNLVTRRLVSLEHLDLPAQIIIYADKVAITAFDTDIMTTIIQNTAINQTFGLIFEFIWGSLKTEDEKIRTGLKEGTLMPPRQR